MKHIDSKGKDINRNGYLDYVKGLLMVLLVYGHCANCIWGGVNPLPWKTIAGTFEMPLFMGISGYLLFKGCQKHDMKELIYGKTYSILLPCIMWELPIFLILGNANIWYLHAAFICSILLICIVKQVQSSMEVNILLILSMIIMYLIPSDYCYLSWMYPFLVMGYYFGKYEKVLIRFVFKKHMGIVYLLGGIFISIIMLCFYKDEFSVYNYGSSLFLHRNVWIHLFRLVVNCICTISVAGISYLLYKKRFLSRLFEKIGRASMVVYIFHGYYLQAIVVKVSNIIHIPDLFSDYKFYFDYIVSFLICIVMIILSLCVYKILEKYQVTRLLLLGDR